MPSVPKSRGAVEVVLGVGCVFKTFGLSVGREAKNDLGNFVFSLVGGAVIDIFLLTSVDGCCICCVLLRGRWEPEEYVYISAL